MNPITIWVRFIGGLVDGLSRLLGRIAFVAAQRSKTVLAIWITLVLLCFIGIIRFNNVTDVNKLWIDVNGVGAQHETLATKYFNASTTYTLLFLAQSKQLDGSNVITKAAFQELFAFKDAMFALTTPTNGATISSLCQRRPDDPTRCVVTGALNFWSVNTTLFDLEATSDTAVQTQCANPLYSDGSRVDTDDDLSAYAVNNGLASAEGFSFIFVLNEPQTSSQTTDVNEMVALGLKLIDDPRWQTLQFYMSYDTAVDDALSSAVSKDIVLMIIAYIIMIVFTQLMLGRPFSLLEGRALLAFEAVLLIIFATVAAFGLCMAFGVPFTTLQEVLPFLLVGVGIDNSFVVLSAVDRTDRKLPIEIRLQKAMSRIGMNITITSFVDIVALLFALVSKLPAVQYFGVYAAVSILSIYLAFITSFVALVAIDERRRSNDSMDCLVCLTAYPAPQVPYAESIPKDTAMKKVDRFITHTYAPCLLRTPVRIFVLAVFAALTGYMVYSATNIGTDFHVEDLTPLDSPVHAYITTHEELFHGLSFPGNSIFLYVQDVDLSSGTVQQNLRDAVTATLNLKSIRGDASPTDWHLTFTTWATSTAPFNTFPRDSTNAFLVGDGFYTALNAFLSVPQFNYLFADNIAFNTTQSIVISRISFTLEYLATASSQVAALTELRAEASQLALAPNAFYHNADESFWEQNSLMKEEATFLFSLTIVAVAGICGLGLVHPLSMLIMALTLGLIFIDLLGALTILGVDLNSISVVNLVMAIGLVVDATAHIIRAFGIQEIDLSKKEKVIRALGELGTPIFLGAITIILGVLPLVGASSEVFRVFFKCFMAIVVIGWTHGLILLPVVLSAIGPTLGTPVEPKVVPPEEIQSSQIQDA